jgi:hypothetical protein
VEGGRLLWHERDREFEAFSLQQRVSLSPACAFVGSRTPAFRTGVRGWLSDRVGRDAQGFRYRADRRQYLCRAIFQYRRVADGVGEEATLVPTKSGLVRA